VWGWDRIRKKHWKHARFAGYAQDFLKRLNMKICGKVIAVQKQEMRRERDVKLRILKGRDGNPPAMYLPSCFPSSKSSRNLSIADIYECPQGTRFPSVNPIDCPVRSTLMQINLGHSKVLFQITTSENCCAIFMR